jgi:hypothetical protein
MSKPKVQAGSVSAQVYQSVMAEIRQAKVQLGSPKAAVRVLQGGTPVSISPGTQAKVQKAK